MADSETTVVTEENTEQDPAEKLYDAEKNTEEESSSEAEEVESKDDGSSEEVTDQESEDAEGDKDQENSGAPEKYGDFEFPEGMELDEAAMEQFLPLAKELDLNQEQAQKLVSMYSQNIQSQIEAQETEYKDVRSEWVKAIKADKEVGGKDYEANLGLARNALKAFGSDELTDMLNHTGLGDNPAVVKFFVKVGKAIKEDGMVSGVQSKAPKDAAKILFPNQN